MKFPAIRQHKATGMQGVEESAPPQRLISGETSADFCRDLLLSLRQPAFWSYSAWLDVATKYRRSRLGILWLLVPSIFYIWGIGPFFASITGHAVGPFVAHMGVGFLVFRVVLMVTTEASSVVNMHQSFILDGHTRLTDFVLRVMAKALFYFLMSLPVMVAAMMMAGFPGVMDFILAVLTFVLVVLNCVWLGTVIALVGARFPDIHELMTSCFIFVFTPIVWHAYEAPMGTYRGIIMRLNPLYYLLEVVRAPLVGQPLSTSALLVVVLMLLVGWLLTAVMYRRYVRCVPLWI